MDMWHCLVKFLLDRSSVFKRLMRSLTVVVMHKLFKTPLEARPTAHPRRMKAVDALFERVKPLSVRFRSV